VQRLMRITRLGRGVEATRSLDSEAIKRTLEVLSEYRSLMDENSVAGLRVAATSAVRDAANSDEFLSAAAEILGVTPEILSGQSEAELSFLGAVSDLDPIDGPFLVADIGGGSTEFAYGTNSVEAADSVQLGCVRMTEKHIKHDPPRPEELTNCLADVRDHLDDVVRNVPNAANASQFVGLAGTVANVAAIELGSAEYDRDELHHFVLTKEAVEDVFRTLATESLADRIHNPGLERARADVIVGGCCVLVATMRYFGFSDCKVSEADILDGLILSQQPASSSAGH